VEAEPPLGKVSSATISTATISTATIVDSPGGEGSSGTLRATTVLDSAKKRGRGSFLVLLLARATTWSKRIPQTCPAHNVFRPFTISKWAAALNAISYRLQLFVAERLIHPFDPIRAASDRPGRQ
jgi:hypothetical protein